MLKRLVGAAVVAALAGCGDQDADAETGGAPRGGEETVESRFEVSVDTQKIADPDTAQPSDN